MSAKVFKIDGVAIPTPSSYDFSIEDLSSEETGRTLDGEMHKDVVAVKDVYTCTWKNVSWAVAAQLMNAINGKTKIAFTYADPRVPDEFITHDFYVGERSGNAVNLNDTKRAWTDIKFSFIRI